MQCLRIFKAISQNNNSWPLLRCAFCRPCSLWLECLLCLTLKVNQQVVPHLWVQAETCKAQSWCTREPFFTPTSSCQLASFPSPRDQMGTRVNGGIQAFGDPPRPYREPVTYSHEGTFYGLGLWCEVLGQVWRQLWSSLKAFGSQPGSMCTWLTVHQTALKSITEGIKWEDGQAAAAAAHGLSDPGGLLSSP